MRTHYAATLKLGLPIAVGQLGVIIMGFADTMMVGQYSTSALAAASFVNNVFNLVTFLILGYSCGLTPLVSSSYGQGKLLEAGGLLRSALTANVLYGLLIFLAMSGLFFFLPYLGQPAELLPLIRPYYLVMLASMFFVVLFNVLRQFAEGTTDTALGMWVLLFGNTLNIIGNYLLIYGIGGLPELGLLGAGIATLFSRFVMVLTMIAALLLKPRYATFRQGFRTFRTRLSDVLRINRISLPVSLQMGIEAGCFTFSAIMAGWIGAVELASYQVMTTIGTLGFLFYYSFGAGTSIRVAAFMGQNDWKNVRLSARAGAHILVCIALFSSLLIIAGSESLIAFFSDDPAVQMMSLSLLVPLVIYQFSDALQICYANALRGTARVGSMMWIAVFSYLIVNIPTGYLLGFTFNFGIYGIFLAFSAGLFTAMALYSWKFYRFLGRREAAMSKC